MDNKWMVAGSESGIAPSRKLFIPGKEAWKRDPPDLSDSLVKKFSSCFSDPNMVIQS